MSDGYNHVESTTIHDSNLERENVKLQTQLTQHKRALELACNHLRRGANCPHGQERWCPIPNTRPCGRILEASKCWAEYYLHQAHEEINDKDGV